MMKNLSNKKNRDVRRAAIIDCTAEVRGVSKRSVQRVLSGDQTNERILSTYFDIDEGLNLLLQNVKLLVPFN